MTRSLSYNITSSDAGRRLDVVMAEQGLYSSRSAAAHAIESGSVFVNGRTVAKRHAVSTGDTIVYEVEEDAPLTPLVGQPIALDIRFEDESLLVLSKQVGLVCHPSADHFDGTLVNALIHHCGAENLCDVQGERDRLGIVHRLDRDTSGLMLAAKTDEVGYALMEAIRSRAVDRRYLALVHGIIVHDTGMIDAPIARGERDRMRMAVRDVPSARDAVTTFRVLERFEAAEQDDGFTLIDCKLFTGRTHQIRVHMEYAKHPLVGDQVYTSGAPKGTVSSLGLQRQFLHSFQITFDHPATGQRLHFVDNVPSDLRRALGMIASRSRGRTAAGCEVFSLLEDAPYPQEQETRATG